MRICTFGCTLANPTRNGFVSDISRRYFDKISLFLTMLEREKWQPESKPTLVCSPSLFRFNSYNNSHVLDLVQQGISEKVALVANFFGAFLCGIILAYIRCWRLALAMMSMFPCVALFGTIMSKFVVRYKE